MQDAMFNPRQATSSFPFSPGHLTHNVIFDLLGVTSEHNEEQQSITSGTARAYLPGGEETSTTAPRGLNAEKIQRAFFD
jgi:hypothetical protein